MSKKWYLSKTIWVNVIIVVSTLATTLATQKLMAAEIGTAISAIANVVLRLLTNQPIQGTPGDAGAKADPPTG